MPIGFESNQAQPSPEPTQLQTAQPQSAFPSDDPGEAFLSWLVEGIANRSLDYNYPSTRIHVVPEGVLLISPGLFQDYVQAGDSSAEPWDKVQKRCWKTKVSRAAGRPGCFPCPPRRPRAGRDTEGRRLYCVRR